MIKWIATVILNRLVFLLAVMLVVSAFTRTTCTPGDSAFGGLGQALASLKEVARALQ